MPKAKRNINLVSSREAHNELRAPMPGRGDPRVEVHASTPKVGTRCPEGRIQFLASDGRAAGPTKDLPDSRRKRLNITN